MTVRGRIKLDQEESSLTVDDDAQEIIEDTSSKRRSRLWRWIVGLAFVIGIAAIALAVLATNDTASPTDTTAALSFESVVQTDLVQVDSFDGTLGTESGDPVNSPTQGTVTSTAAVGTTVEQGDVFLTVNNEPVVLLYGDLPAYRRLSATEDSLSVVGNAGGVVTEVVAEGETIAQGDVLYRVSGEPVVVMYGDIPAYRTLRDLNDNMTGDDVLQLETALVALGYDPDGVAAVDTEFTDYTATMVERWQADLDVEEDGIVQLGDVIFIPEEAEVLAVSVEVGQSVGPGQPLVTVSAGDPLQGDDVAQLETALVELGYSGITVDGVWDEGTKSAVLAWQEDVGSEADGAIDLGEVVFLPSPVRVNDVLAAVGSSVTPGSPVLAVSSADKFVTFDLPAADQGLVAVGQEVNIELPDGTDTPGTVTAVASVATSLQGGGAAFEVKIVLDDPTVAAGLDEAPVDVEVSSDSVSDVMAIPVSALVALAEGGYAVEVDGGDGSTQLVAVDPGFYAGGMVEVTSDLLEVGDRVVVP
jgi:peptidoglycan hydrolase-like protein with peptidoglycan-binding domain